MIRQPTAPWNAKQERLAVLLPQDGPARTRPGARQDRRPDGEEGLRAPKKATGGNYTVKRGDTLSRIAKAHGKSVSALLSANRGVVSNPNVLKVGVALSV